MPCHYVTRRQLDIQDSTIDAPDAQLVARSLEAREAFDELVKRHYAMVYSVAYSRVGQRETAEEIAQETFLRAYFSLEKLKEPAAFAGWLVSITRNLAGLRR
jgi:RNA polymerase sigma-70 factor, ECF subfamily